MAKCLLLELRDGDCIFVLARLPHTYLDAETHDALASQPLVGEAWNRHRISSFFHGGAAGTDRAAPAQEQIPRRGSGPDRGRVVRGVVGYFVRVYVCLELKHQLHPISLQFLLYDR